MFNVKSNLDKIVGMKSMFSSAFVSSQRPKTELAAARTEHLEFKVVVMPAFAMEIVWAEKVLIFKLAKSYYRLK